MFKSWEYIYSSDTFPTQTLFIENQWSLECKQCSFIWREWTLCNLEISHRLHVLACCVVKFLALKFLHTWTKNYTQQDTAQRLAPLNPRIPLHDSGIRDRINMWNMLFMLFCSPSFTLSLFLAAYQPAASSQNYHYEPAPEPVRQAAAAPPPSAGVGLPGSCRITKKTNVHLVFYSL